MRIKINTNDGAADKLKAVSCQLSAYKKPSAKSHQLKAIPKANSYKLKANEGFTLVELLVTLSLFVVITTIVLFSQSKFNGSILLTNLAYDVALTVRQAQTFGVNVREVSSGGGDFQKAYGVHFDATDADSKKKFILFIDDVSVNGKYDSSDSIVNTYSVKRGNYIKNICIESACTSVNKLDITFIRPNPDAIIKGDSYSDAAEAKITISSADGNTRNIVVNSTGQISIQKNEN